MKCTYRTPDRPTSSPDTVHTTLRRTIRYFNKYPKFVLSVLCSVDRASRYNRVKKNQLDAQLILCIFRQPLHVSGVFRPIIRRYCTTVCIQLVLILFRWLSVNSHLNRIISANYCIHTVVQYLLMTGLNTPETRRGWRNIQRISCASSWFYFTRSYY